MFTEFLLHARVCARSFICIIFANPQNILESRHHFTTGEMEQLTLIEVKGPVPGCPASPRHLDSQDLAGSRALVVSKVFPEKDKIPGSHGVQGWLPGCRKKLQEEKKRQKWKGKKKNILPRVVCEFQHLMINVGWRGEKMKRAPWRPENCFLRSLVKHGQLRRAES